MRRRLWPQPRAPSHALAPRALLLRSPGYALCHTAAAAPTTSSIFVSSSPSPPPLSPEHHPATHPAAGSQRPTAGSPRGAGRRRGAMGEGSGGDRRRHFGMERVCSPSWAARAPYNVVVLLFFCHIIVLLINTNPMVYVLCIQRGRARASVLAVRAGELSVRGDELASSETADRGQGHAARGRAVAASWAVSERGRHCHAYAYRSNAYKTSMTRRRIVGCCRRLRECLESHTHA